MRTVLDFTVVAFLVTLIATVVYVNIFERHVGSATAKIQADLSCLRYASRQFRKDLGRFPVSPSELLGENEKSKLFIEEIGRDAWGRPYMFHTFDIGENKTVLLLISLGADPADSSDDVIFQIAKNWCEIKQVAGAGGVCGGQ